MECNVQSKPSLTSFEVAFNSKVAIQVEDYTLTASVTSYVRYGSSGDIDEIVDTDSTVVCTKASIVGGSRMELEAEYSKVREHLKTVGIVDIHKVILDNAKKDIPKNIKFSIYE